MHKITPHTLHMCMHTTMTPLSLSMLFQYHIVYWIHSLIFQYFVAHYLYTILKCNSHIIAYKSAVFSNGINSNYTHSNGEKKEKRSEREKESWCWGFIYIVSALSLSPLYHYFFILFNIHTCVCLCTLHAGWLNLNWRIMCSIAFVPLRNTYIYYCMHKRVSERESTPNWNGKNETMVIANLFNFKLKNRIGWKNVKQFFLSSFCSIVLLCLYGQA